MCLSWPKLSLNVWEMLPGYIVNQQIKTKVVMVMHLVESYKDKFHTMLFFCKMYVIGCQGQTELN